MTFICCRLIRSVFFVSLLSISTLTFAQGTPPGILTVASPHTFEATLARLEKAIEANKMGLVAQASASRGAAARGVKIPGNAVLMVFRNDYAVRMLSASIPAGIEAPLRVYVTEDGSGSTSIAWRTATSVFSPYGNADLSAMARELDPILERIVRDAATK